MSDQILQRLDLNLLKVFEVLYQEQNMTRASEILYMTPSAVSHAVKRLRSVLKEPLFERKGSNMLPTATCQRIAPQIFEHLAGLKASLQQFSQFDPDNSNHLFKIAVHDALEPLFMPSLILKLRDVSEHLGLNCVQLERQQMERQLASGMADLAIDVAMPLRAPILHQALSKDKFVVLSRTGLWPDGLSRQNYLSSQHVTVSHRPKGRVMEDIGLQNMSINRDVPVRCQNYHTAKALLMQSDLLLTLPHSIAETLIDQHVERHPLPIAVPEVEIHLYWHEYSERDSASMWLKQQLLSMI